MADIFRNIVFIVMVLTVLAGATAVMLDQFSMLIPAA